VLDLGLIAPYRFGRNLLANHLPGIELDSGLLCVDYAVPHVLDDLLCLLDLIRLLRASSARA
jgi:hypothetical protein